MYRRVIKPAFDISLGLIVFVLSTPIFLTVTMLLALFQNGAIFFTQNRPGKKGKIFKLIKFKTMSDKRNAIGDLLPDVERLTLAGRIVRKTSLDEIPQLINVIKGEMSLIGPRPLLVEYLPLYNETQKRRHDVKPGITGWAQVNGRNMISWEKKFELDVWYIDNLSFWLDMKILFMTIKKVFISEGVSSGTSVTMEKFTGN